MNTTLTIEIDEALKNDFTAAAAARGCNHGQLLRELLSDFTQRRQDAEYDAWFREKTRIGLEQANAGMVISSEAMEAEAARWYAETERKMDANIGVDR